ncbi:MAG TPA: efflux RND transporter permease subunit, partial [Nitrospinota bacterium]|nr:efflux RND transporter permease subunit [Nitrospinota bacterium]
MQHTLEKEIQKIEEVKNVFAKIGTAEIATDPMPPSVADVFAMIKPREEWPDPGLTKENLIKKFEDRMNKVAGSKYEIIQPIEMRFNELIAGVRSDIAVKVFGDEMDALLQTGKKIEKVLLKIAGASDVKVEQVTGLPIMTIKINRQEMARYGLNISDVHEVIEIAIGGKQAGQIFEGDRRFDLLVRLPDDMRDNLEALQRIPIPLPNNNRKGKGLTPTAFSGNSKQPPYIPLGSVAEFNIAPGPNQISRENGKRRVVVTANVRGRDIGSFVKEAEQKINEEVTIPAGYWIKWGGQFEHMISAAKRLQIVVPVALLLILFLLFTTFGTVKDALLVFTGIPLALTGGIVSLWIRGIPLSISAAVGFIALSGVAVLNGLVMISFINQLRLEGLPLKEAIFQGSIKRLRPVLMTALVASLGFLPMAIATGAGAEVQRPLATVVIGGILSSTALTLIVLPVLYSIFHRTKNKTII